MKTEKGIGVDGIGNTGLSINVRDTAMNFEILKDKIGEDDLGESETLFEWQGNNFLDSNVHMVLGGSPAVHIHHASFCEHHTAYFFVEREG